MGIFGQLAGEGLGKLAGQYFAGDKGSQIGGDIGKFAGSYLPFARGGYVCPCEAKRMKKLRKRMRKGGIAEDEMAEMAGGGYVAPAQPNPFLGYKTMPYRHGDANYMMF